MSDGIKGDDIPAMPPQVNGDNVLHIDIDLSIDYKDYERISKVWGEEIVLTRSKYYTCKLLVVKPEYTSSHHSHKVKDETFICVKGQGNIIVRERIINVLPGDQVDIPVNIPHSFRSMAGMVLMEISTFDDAADSYRVTQSRKIERQ